VIDHVKEDPSTEDHRALLLKSHGECNPFRQCVAALTSKSIPKIYTKCTQHLNQQLTVPGRDTPAKYPMVAVTWHHAGVHLAAENSHADLSCGTCSLPAF
jgi:hypothetical protein